MADRIRFPFSICLRPISRGSPPRRAEKTGDPHSGSILANRLSGFKPFPRRSEVLPARLSLPPGFGSTPYKYLLPSKDCFFARSWSDVFRNQTIILVEIPFTCDFWIFESQTVFIERGMVIGLIPPAHDYRSGACTNCLASSGSCFDQSCSRTSPMSPLMQMDFFTISSGALASP